MRIVREMQAGVPDGCGCHRQFEKERERDRVHPMHGVRQELPEEGALSKCASMIDAIPVFIKR